MNLKTHVAAPAVLHVRRKLSRQAGALVGSEVACGRMKQRGSGLWKWLAAVFRHPSGVGSGPAPHLRRPFIRRRWNTTELQFAHGVSQSRMLT
jgi:hypothetical protein